MYYGIHRDRCEGTECSLGVLGSQTRRWGPKAHTHIYIGHVLFPFILPATNHECRLPFVFLPDYYTKYSSTVYEMAK